MSILETLALNWVQCEISLVLVLGYNIKAIVWMWMKSHDGIEAAGEYQRRGRQGRSHAARRWRSGAGLAVEGATGGAPHGSPWREAGEVCCAARQRKERWSHATEVLLAVLELLAPELLPVVLLLPVLLRVGGER